MKNWRKEVTPFQGKVYEAVLTIPKGKVRTYAWVAQAIGKPKAARAVGQALKRNRWAPRIPCHRVVASNGGLGGYSAPGGLRQKRELLYREGASASLSREKADRIARRIVHGGNGNLSLEERRLATEAGSLIIQKLRAHRSPGRRAYARLRWGTGRRAIDVRKPCGDTVIKQILRRVDDLLGMEVSS